MRFDGKVALVTGGGSGIGRAICLGLSKEGATVAPADLRLDSARETASQAEALGRKALAVQVDITSREQCAAAVKQVVDRFGRLDILVNDAGIGGGVPFLEMTNEMMDKHLMINLHGHMHMCQAVLPLMVKQGYGKIVNISSDAGVTGSAKSSAYSAAKGGLISFTKSIAREFAPKGININCVFPGPTDSPLFQRAAADPARRQALVGRIVLGRPARPEEIAYGVLFFCSDESSYITGQVLGVDGGISINI